MALDHSNVAAWNVSHIGTYDAQTSPSRRFVSLSGIALGEVGPSLRMRLRILLVDVGASQVKEILPLVEGKWVVAWAKNDTLVVCGMSDIGRDYMISAYECHVSQPVLQRIPTDAEVKLVIELFYKKYGIDPSPINRTS